MSENNSNTDQAKHSCKTGVSRSFFIITLVSVFSMNSCALDKKNNDTITIVEKGTNVKFIIKYNTDNVHIIGDDKVLIYANDSTNIIKQKK